MQECQGRKRYIFSLFRDQTPDPSFPLKMDSFSFPYIFLFRSITKEGGGGEGWGKREWELSRPSSVRALHPAPPPFMGAGKGGERRRRICTKGRLSLCPKIVSEWKIFKSKTKPANLRYVQQENRKEISGAAIYAYSMKEGGEGPPSPSLPLPLRTNLISDSSSSVRRREGRENSTRLLWRYLAIVRRDASPPSSSEAYAEGGGNRKGGERKRMGVDGGIAKTKKRFVR